MWDNNNLKEIAKINMVEMVKWITETMAGRERGIVIMNRTMKKLKSFEYATQSMKYFLKASGWTM